MKKLMSLTTEEKNITALLASLCMFLSVIEYLVPKPIPFLRIGIANMPVLLSLKILPARGSLLLICLKILGQGLVNGTLFSYIFLFSASGSFASGIVMLCTYNFLRNNISLIGISVFGALSGNLVQIFFAKYLIFGQAALLIGPFFLIAGTISAVCLGFFAEKFIIKSVWIQKCRMRLRR